MKKSSRLSLISLASAIACVTSSAGAKTPVAASAGTTASASAAADWAALLDSLRDLPSRILAKLPEEQQHDPLIQHEVNQLALSALATSSLSALGSDLDHPMFLPLTGPIFGTGQPNSDTIYRIAQIAPDGSYRLRGQRGSLRILNIAQHGPVPGDLAAAGGTVGPPKSSLDLNALHGDAHDRFDLIISPSRPARYTGDWWQLEPGVAKLMVRMVSSAWGKEIEPTLSIERLDRPVRRVRPTAAELSDRLHRLAIATNFIGPLLVGDPGQLAREGYVNKLREHTTNRGLLPGQNYYYGAYDLKDDEALIVEAPLPVHCTYRSIILINHLYETTDWYNNQSSLNEPQAKGDKDGVLRIVVSAHDPGVPNWLDTAGYPQGMIQGRWTGCDTKPVPTVTKVAFTDIRKALPAGTPVVSPGQREQIIRERRAALQQRPLW